MKTIEELLDQVERAQGKIVDRDEVVAALKATRGGSRFAGPDATPEVVATLAAGGTVGGDGTVKDASGRHVGTVAQGSGAAGGMTKALAEATSTAGGVLVPVEVSRDIAQLIYARSAVTKMLPTVTKVGKELDVPQVATGSTALYVAENAAIPASEPTFGLALQLRPRELVALVPISNRLLRDANPEVEQAVRTDLADVMAARQDLAFIIGGGGAIEPLGIKNTPNLTAAPNLGANGATPTFDNLKDQVAALRNVNAPFQRPGWIFAPRTLNTIEKIKDSQGRYLAETGLLTYDAQGGGGALLGFKFATTTAVPVNLTKGTNNDTSFVIFGSDWNEAWVGQNLDLVVEASNEATYLDTSSNLVSAWASRQTVFRAIAAHDFGLRRPTLFSVMDGVRP